MEEEAETELSTPPEADETKQTPKAEDDADENGFQFTDWALI